MPFNANTYRANRDERRARECMARARELRAEGAPADRVALEVKLARNWVRIARAERDLARPDGPPCGGDTTKCSVHGAYDLDGNRECRR